MGITTALSIALSGLKANQNETELVSRNIANADTAGYTAKRLVRSDRVEDQSLIGVRTVVQRQVDSEVTRQLNTSTSTSSYLDTMKTYLSQVDQMLGSTSSGFNLSDLVESFTETMQTLSSSPDDQNAQIKAVNAASDLASGLNQLSDDTQQMRTDIETAIGDGVTQVNTLLTNIETYNRSIISNRAAGIDTSELEDARDTAISSLAGWVDIKTYENSNGSIYVYTGSGTQLVGSQAGTLGFDQRGTLSASTEWSADSSERGVGTITLSNGGQPVDLLTNGSIQSGKLAALVELRDNALVDLQAQLDDVAAGLAQAMSDTTVAGTPTTNGSQAGFTLDLGDVAAGNSVSIDVKSSAGKTTSFTFIRVDDAATLPLDNTATGKPNDTVVGIDWSGGWSSVAAQVQAALGSAYTVNVVGTGIEVLDAGTGASVTAASVTNSNDGTQNGETALALFVDGTGGGLYTGNLDGGSQKTGFAGRITVNKAVTSDPTLLITYDSDTEAGDPTRPKALAQRIATTQFSFGAETGLVSSGGATTGTLDSFVNTMTSHWGGRAETAAAAKDSQDIIQSNLEARYSDQSAVNIDAEMARLIQIQSAYAANARVFTVAKEMLDVLMQS
jgi:flagellar hook-associated protein 1 FlgK